MNKSYFITTAIPYVNARPHIGFALEIVQADCIARYHRLLGEDVYFLTGTDENALKNVQAAEKEGISPKELVDKYAKIFADLKKPYNLSYDGFIRTTEQKHIRGAQKLWRETKKDDIYKKKYKGLYCVGCEQFYTEDELIESKCPEHLVKLQLVAEENYFFRLSTYQERLEKLIESDALKIIPQTRKNEVLAFIKQGLEDFSISRSIERAKGWGVPVPEDPNQIMYVWYDALANYITALGYGDEDEELFERFWLDNPHRVHVIGKGITRFHAVYWPAMLLSAGLPLPTLEFVHGYITSEGQKMSKSLGNVVDPFELVKKYGTDAVRYYLLREIPSYGDGDYSERRFKEVYNADLANGLGNLVARIVALSKRINFHLEHSRPILSNEYKQKIEEFKFNEVLEDIWKKIHELDRTIDREAPWRIVEKDKLSIVLLDISSKLNGIAQELSPFLPETAQKIKEQLFSGSRVQSQKLLFPRL